MTGSIKTTTAKAKLRVAMLIHSLHGGGAERVMSQLASRWSQQHEVHLITWSKVESDCYPLSNSVVRYGLDLQVPSRGLFGGLGANVKRVRKLRSTLRQVNPDIVLSFCDQMNIVSLEAMRAMPHIPIWIAEHSDPEKQQLGRMWEAWRGRTYPRCTGCVVLTESIAKYMNRWIPQERLRVIPAVIQTNPAVLPAYSSSQQPEMNSVLFVGRLSPEKRVDLLIEAWKQVEARLANWQLLVVGDGALRDELEKSASQVQRVKFLGWQNHPEQIMATCQMFVLCSSYEGFPVAMLEAMNYGLPAIATNCSSAISQLTTLAGSASSATALTTNAIKIIPTQSVTQLAEAILELAHDLPLRQNMSQAARRVAENFTWEAVGPEWDAVLQTALA